MFFEALEKYDEIVDVDQGALPFNRRQNNVHRHLKGDRSDFQSKWHTHIPVQAIFTNERRLIHVFIVQFYPTIATFVIQCREYAG